MLPAPIIRATLLMLILGGGSRLAAEGTFYTLDHNPFLLMTDLGANEAAKKKSAGTYMKWIAETANYFLKVYELDKNCFSTWADTYDPSGKEWERIIRFTVWEKHEDFLADFQKRYETKTIPGAYFGWGYQPKDEYGKPMGMRIREIHAYAEGQTEAEILRHLYHEMGHLFMKTFIIWPVEVPSWIEEGTAQIFQFRIGNGTNPEEDRDERRGWVIEMIAEESAIPWKDFMEVKNIDNLDFTWQDPLRSTIQYAQAWSVMEFMLENPQRRNAFSKLLKSFKDSGRDAVIEANRRRLNGDAARKHYDGWLYERQHEFFRKAYGADLLQVEAAWKQWVQKSYEKDVKKNPILRYHRGGWHLLRADRAKGEEAKTTALARAEAIFSECVEVTPTLPEGHVGLGRVALARGDNAKADEHFAKATELGSDSFEAQVYGGIALIRAGRAAEAVPGLMKAAEKRPTHFDANYRLGLALAMSGGDGDLAKTHLARARSMRSEMTAECALAEGMVDYQKGNVAEAMSSFLRAMNKPEGNPVPALAFALCKAADGDVETAEKVLAQATAQGNPFAKPVLDRIKAGDAPKLVFTTTGVVLVEGLMRVAE